MNKPLASVLQIQKRNTTNKPHSAPSSMGKTSMLPCLASFQCREQKAMKQIAGTLLSPINPSLWLTHLHTAYLLSASLMSLHSIQRHMGWNHCLQVQIDEASWQTTGCFRRHPLPAWTCWGLQRMQKAFCVTRLFVLAGECFWFCDPLWLLSARWGLAEESRHGSESLYLPINHPLGL